MKITIPQNEINEAARKQRDRYLTNLSKIATIDGFRIGADFAISTVNERLCPVLENLENTLNSVYVIAENEEWEKALTGRQLVFKEIQNAISEIKNLTKPE